MGLSKIAMLFLVFLPIFAGCDGQSQFEHPLAGGTGTLSINGGPPMPFIVNNVNVSLSPSTSTITLVTFEPQGPLTLMRSIYLIAPPNQVGVMLDLATTGSFLTEVMVDPVGQVVSTEFDSQSVAGDLVISEINELGAKGSFNALFTDDLGNTREIVDGVFDFDLV